MCIGEKRKREKKQQQKKTQPKAKQNKQAIKHSLGQILSRKIFGRQVRYKQHFQVLTFFAEKKNRICPMQAISICLAS